MNSLLVFEKHSNGIPASKLTVEGVVEALVDVVYSMNESAASLTDDIRYDPSDIP